MDELLTEQLIGDSACCDYSFGGIAQAPRVQPTTTNRSLLKQLSSKLLQTASSKSSNNENVNSTGIQTNQCTSVSQSARSTNQTSSVTLANGSINLTDSALTNSTSSLNSTGSTACSTASSTSVQSICSNNSLINLQSQATDDQVDTNLSISLNKNCSINLNESSEGCQVNSQPNQLESKQSSTNQAVNQATNQATSQTSQTTNQITMTNCNKCLVKFTVFRRKHPCFKCNKPFCSNCLATQKIKIKDNSKICIDCSTNEQSKQQKVELAIEGLINEKRLDTVNVKNCKLDPSSEMKEDNHVKQGEQIIAQVLDARNDQATNLENQINNQANNTLNDLDRQNTLNNLSINSALSTNINSNLNLSTANGGTTKNDFVIISVLKKQPKQGVTKTDATTTKKVCFSPEVKVFGLRPGEESMIEQQRAALLPSLLTVNSLNANLMANLTATNQIPSSRLSFLNKPFLAHSQLTYAQKGLLLNGSSTAPRRSSKRHHLSSSQHSHRQLTHQKLIQLSATSGTLRNTAATYTVLTKTAGTKLNQTSSNKHLASNSTRSSNSNRKQFVYLTNGKLLVNSYSNYNDMFQNEKLFTSYVLLA